MEKEQETGVWPTVKPEPEAGGGGEAVIQPAVGEEGARNW